MDIVRQLLLEGADVNAVSENGETALMWAVKKAQLEVVSLLLHFNADPWLAAEVDRLPVHCLLFVFVMQFDCADELEILRLLVNAMGVLPPLQQKNVSCLFNILCY